MRVSPKVSIVIPVYNGARYLREAIDSALGQTYRNIEVIVVNDGSRDSGKTEDVALSYGNRVRYFAKQNGGVASALNCGIEMMTGDYFSWLSHDDVYYPFKLEKQVARLADFAKNTVFYSDYDLIDAESRLIRTERIRHVEPAAFLHALITSNPIHGCTVLMSKRCFDAGRFDESLRTTQDYQLWFRMARFFEFVHLPEVLIKSRVHQEQGTITMNSVHFDECNNFFMQCIDELLQDKAGPSLDLQPATIMKFAANLRKRGFNRAADYIFSQAQRNLAKKGSALDPGYWWYLLQYTAGGLKNLKRF